jgi:hypothetical protein
VLAVVKEHASQCLGTLDEVQQLSTAYFQNIYHRMPILSHKRFSDRLPALAHDADADFIALCMCIRLVEKRPNTQAQSMQSSLYVTLKGIISLFEAAGHLSLEVVQCRLLVTFYEMGHAIYPAASISAAACARSIRALNFHPRRSVGMADGFEAEEQKRAWWASVNLDR